MRRFWQKIMSHLEMRSFEPHYDPDETEMSAQERLLFNNNYNSNHHNHLHNHHNHHHHHHHHLHNSNNHIPNNSTGTAGSIGSGNSGTGSSVSNDVHHNNHNNMPPMAMTNLDEENHYQLPYAHLHQQSPYMTSPINHQLHQPPPPHLQQHQHGSYSSGDDHSSTYGGGPRPPMNGHGGIGTLGSVGGSTGIYPHPYAGTFGTLQEKYSVAYPVRGEADSMMGRGGNRNTGSGIVYRPRRRFWWCAMMLALVLLILAGAVVIAVYFTVLKKDPEPAQVATNGNGGEIGSYNHGSGDESGSYNSGRSDNVGVGGGGDPVTKQPTYVVPGTFTTPGHGGEPDKGITDTTKVTKFDAFWHPGDSRLFRALLANGSVIEVFGPKKSDGTVRSIYALSLKDQGSDNSASTRYIRFQESHNIISVVLPNGVIVAYDLSTEKFKVEVKIYEPIADETRGPISHLAKIDPGVGQYALARIKEAFAKMPNLTSMPNSGGRTRFSAKCFSRFPVKVNKCGGKYPYDGAFVQGEISGLGPPIRMAALPWPRDSSDPCYQKDHADTDINYYLPLPGMVDNDNATMIKEAYVASSAKIFYKLCDVVTEQIHLQRHGLCSEMAEKVRTQLGYNQLLDIVYTSCSAIFYSLNAVCVAVNDISANENLPFSENSILQSFHRRISDSFPVSLPDQVNVKTHAFCPSSVPFSSYDSPVTTGSIRGNVVQDAIHINCPDHPEVTMMGLAHKLTMSRDQTTIQSLYDQVVQNFRICSICSFEKRVTVEIRRDSMYCNNTCSDKHSTEVLPNDRVIDTKYYDQQESVYCNAFFTNNPNSLQPPIGEKCVGNCMSSLKVHFYIEDPKTSVVYYRQDVDCSELKKSHCTVKFGK